MSDTSANLALPYLLPNQAQKHVTVNEALGRLDQLVQLSAESRALAAPPASPSEGSVYIVAAPPSGAWAGTGEHALAAFMDGAWQFVMPGKGWRAFVKDEDALCVFTGTAWQPLLEDTPALSGTNAWTGEQIFPGGQFQSSASGIQTWTPHATDGRFLFYQDQSDEFVLEAINKNTLEKTCLNLMKYGGTLERGGHAVYDAGQSPVPTTDAACDLGAPDKRFSSIYAVSGVVSTSDARLKSALTPLPETVLRAGQRIIATIGVYRWTGGAGLPDGRQIGVTAQSVMDAFEAENEDALEWGLLSAPDGREGTLGLRTDQLLLLLLACLFQAYAAR